MKLPLPRRGCLLAAALVSPFLCRAADPLDALEKSAGEWVKVRMEAGRLESGWLAERALLESALAALQERATVAEEERDLLKAKTAKEREELAALQEKARQADGDLADLDARLRRIGEQLIALRPSLPPRLSGALEMSFRSLAEPDARMGERLQTCMTVLNRCVQFNRQISAGEEALSVDANGTRKSLEVIYWGLSHGYALDRGADQAWLGAPTADGWRWKLQPAAAPGVARLLAIHQDKADPDFVFVPASLRHSPTEARQP